MSEVSPNRLSMTECARIGAMLDAGITIFTVRTANRLLLAAREASLPVTIEEELLRLRVDHVAGKGGLVQVHPEWVEFVLNRMGWTRPAQAPVPPRPEREPRKRPTSSRPTPKPDPRSDNSLICDAPHHGHPSRDRRQVRIDAMYRLRQQGMTYGAIAAAAGRSVERVRQIILREDWRRGRKKARPQMEMEAQALHDQIKSDGFAALAHVRDALTALQRRHPDAGPRQSRP